MTSVDELNAISFQIIAAVGNARSLYIKAIKQAKAGNFEQADALMDEGAASFSQGHAAHTGLIQHEAAGDPTQMTLILTHAEDQLMSAEAFGILAREFIDVYRSGAQVPAGQANAVPASACA